MYFDKPTFALPQKIQQKKLSMVLCLNILLMTGVATAEDEINISEYGALRGYDPVSYFSGKPVRGRELISSIINNVEYHFSTISNKRKFDNTPEAYIPMYGGYCAYGVRMGKKLNIDPLAFEIINDQIYVLLNRATHKIWQQNIAENIRVADSLWPQIKTKSIKSLQ